MAASALTLSGSSSCMFFLLLLFFFFPAKHTAVTKQSPNPSAGSPFQVRVVDSKWVDCWITCHRDYKQLRNWCVAFFHSDITKLLRQIPGSLPLVCLRLGWNLVTAVASSHCFYLLLYKGTGLPRRLGIVHRHLLSWRKPCSRSLAHFLIVTSVFQKSSSSIILSIIYMEF